MSLSWWQKNRQVEFNLTGSQRFSSHRKKKVVLCLHLVANLSKCSSKRRLVPCGIAVLCQVELHVRGKPVLVSGRVQCTSGGFPDAPQRTMERVAVEVPINNGERQQRPSTGIYL